jgi:tetratricopeptide (TPR) repeat protein
MRSPAAALLLAAAVAVPARAHGQAPAGGPPREGRPAQAQGQAPRGSQDDVTAQARSHFRKGTELYRQARYREAIAEFELAYRLRPHGVIHFNLAQCHERLGDIPAALQSYHEYLRAVPDAEDRRNVMAAMANLEARLGASGVQQLLVYSDPSGAEVLVDGQSRGRSPLALVLPHGSHSVALVKQGYRTTTRQVVLSSQVSVEMDVSLQKVDAGLVPLPPPPVVAAPGAAGHPGPQAGAPGAPGAAAAKPAPPSATAPAPQPRPAGPRPRVWTWVAAGAAAAALGAGAYYGASARSAERDLMGGAPDRATADRWASQARSRARTANILYGVGGAAAAGAGALFVFEGGF